MLSEQNLFDDILWVAHEFAAGVRAGRPMAELKVGVGSQRDPAQGPGRSPGSRSSTATTSREFTLIRSGSRRRLAVSVHRRDLFGGVEDRAGKLFVQARFEGVYDGVRVRAMHYTLRDGTSPRTRPDPGELGFVPATRYSGVEAYVEVRSDLEASEVAHVELEYSCREHELSKRVARDHANAPVTNVGDCPMKFHRHLLRDVVVLTLPLAVLLVYLARRRPR